MDAAWNAEHAVGRIVRPLRANGVAYRGINTVMLWSEVVTKGFAVPIWMTFKQAKELGRHVRKRESGSLVFYANTLHRTETDEKSGEEVERDIPSMKGYIVFNVEQIEGLPEHYTRPAHIQLNPVQRIAAADAFFAATGADISYGGTAPCGLYEQFHATRHRSLGCHLCRNGRLCAAKANFSWSATDKVNFDLHDDGGGEGAS